MNAYELAEMVRNEPFHTNLNRNTIADFICQQAGEIGCYKIELELQKAMVQDQADRIAELEKQCAKYEELIANWDTLQTKQTPDGLIDPKSYYIGYDDGKKANPVKELTGGYEVLDMNEYDVTVRMTVSDWETILRKAQEK